MVKCKLVIKKNIFFPYFNQSPEQISIINIYRDTLISDY